MVLGDYISTSETTAEISEKLAHMDNKRLTLLRLSLLVKKNILTVILYGSYKPKDQSIDQI